MAEPQGQSDRIGASAHRSRRTSKRVTVGEVVRAGLLTVGDRFVWNRPRKHEIWRITVTESGFRERMEPNMRRRRPLPAPSEVPRRA